MLSERAVNSQNDGEEKQKPGHPFKSSLYYSKMIATKNKKTDHIKAKRLQKKRLQKKYQQTKKHTEETAKKVQKILLTTAGKFIKAATAAIKQHPLAFFIILLAALLFLIILTVFSSLSVTGAGAGKETLAVSFTADDEDIIAAEEDYKALESELQTEINDTESKHPGYDEYRYSIAEISHDPFELAACLTVFYEAYKREDVSGMLSDIFNQQYEFTLTQETEIRYREEEHTELVPEMLPDGIIIFHTETSTVTVPYDYTILNITLKNSGIKAVVNSMELTQEQRERYSMILLTKGNRPDVFGENVYSGSSEYTLHEIPGEYLTDTRFAAMIKEGEKYLGYPYVWGGSSPETSFDCSGYVCWILNHTGWSVGRRTANGLCQMCTKIESKEAKPGDLIFFEGTYETEGASHVGIYVGDHWMLHCVDPISYARTDTDYWQEHFYCYGRMP